MERTRFLEAQGYTVLRFWNNEILKDIEAVMKVILDVLEGGETSSMAHHTDP